MNWKGFKGNAKFNRRVDEVHKEHEFLYGRTSDKYWRLRRRTFRKDGFKCSSCGSKEDLRIHHLIPWDKYPSYRFSDDNCVTLCRSCHAERHPWLKK